MLSVDRVGDMVTTRSGHGDSSDDSSDESSSSSTTSSDSRSPQFFSLKEAVEAKTGLWKRGREGRLIAPKEGLLTIPEAVYYVLSRTTVPLTTQHLWYQLCHGDIHPCVSGAKLKKRLSTGDLRHKEFLRWGPTVLLASREEEMRMNSLISRDYQRLGMSLMPQVGHYYVPPEAEMNFFEWRPSTIAGSGLGLFMRRYRSVRFGTILAEYRGRVIRASEHGLLDGAYTIRLRCGMCIDALELDALGTGTVVMSLAALINDHGPQRANVEFKEFEDFPQRIFVVALRDIRGGEEIFTTYGARFWGAESYDDLVLQEHSRRVSAVPVRVEDPQSRCRACKAEFPNRLKRLHVCADKVIDAVPRCIDPLPKHTLTAMDRIDQRYMQRGRLFWSTYFVVAEDPATYAFTHDELENDSDSPKDGSDPVQ